MREIKFRWKSLLSGLWQFCNLIHNNQTKVYSIKKGAFVINVIPETVGQFTGLKDCNGIDIYEGDVVRIAGYGNLVVEFPFTLLYEALYEDNIENILGNIIDNPELLNSK